ncbi:MAG: hypothetical protein KDD22_03900 [Bdellovibrionales bacterium]|nr:hypothetical protein [Bdellovibrionales bacterium]
MKVAVVLNGSSTLDFQDVRTNVARIPEVCARIREAQEILDSKGHGELDFAQLLGSEDRVFLSNLKLKTLLVSIVQVGLYDRYLKSFSAPHFIIGNLNGDSAYNVITQGMSFERMISAATLGNRRGEKALEIVPSEGPTETLLAGVTLVDYGVTSLRENQLFIDPKLKGSLVGIVSRLIDEYQVRKFVSIGPGQMLLPEERDQISLREIQLVESIDMDPLLSWFWSSLRGTLRVG